MSQIEIDSTTPVSTIMSNRVVTVTPDDSLNSVRRLFDKHKFHHLIVVDRDKAVGVISQRDLLKHLSPFVGTLSEKSRDSWTLDKRVHQVMTRSIVWMEADAPITEAALLMAANRISCLPVLDRKGHPIGILTSRDVLRWVADRLLSHPEDGAKAA
ncbi:MAG: CBS domain-containing protein [Phycisphaera sp.]|nr:MAG: CBS domain-containing protein [Phycisphaera sp.]